MTYILEGDDYEIKMDGEKASFEGGATRYTKTGKGRFDLIPKNVYESIAGQILTSRWFNFGASLISTPTVLTIVTGIHDESNQYRFVDLIIALTIHKYGPKPDPNVMPMISEDQFMLYFCEMERELAIHYEKGAEKYGVDNWKKGIPITGGDRGGSFEDSGLRHLNQYLRGMDDENHFIACIWNFWCAEYTRLVEAEIENEKLKEEDIL